MSEGVEDYNVSDISLLDLPILGEPETKNNTPFAGRQIKEMTENERMVYELNKKGLTVEDYEAMVKKAYEEGQSLGYQEGLEKGHEEGLSKGLEKAQTVVDAKLNTLESMIDDLSAPLSKNLEQIEGTLINVMFKVCSFIINKDLAEDEERYKSVLNKAISSIPPSDEQVKIKVSPHDRGLIQDLAAKKGWELINDEEIAQGGFRVESGLCTVDATIEATINELMEEFKSTMTPEAREVVDVIEPNTMAPMLQGSAPARTSRSGSRSSSSSRSSGGSRSSSSSRSSRRR